MVIMITKLFMWRKRLGLSQREAADRIGVPTQTYRLLEQGWTSSSERVREALERAFGASAESMHRPEVEQ